MLLTHIEDWTLYAGIFIFKLRIFFAVGKQNKIEIGWKK